MADDKLLDQSHELSVHKWYSFAAENHSEIRSFVGHNAVFVNNRIYIVSGADLKGVDSQVLYYNIGDNAQSYHVLECSGIIPRYEFSLFKFELYPNRIFIFGGANTFSNLNSLQYLNIETNKWETVENSQSQTPSPRTAHSCAFGDNAMYLFGGGDSASQPLQDSHLYVLEANNLIWKSFQLPLGPRQCHAMVYCQKTVYIHGGLCGGEFFSQLIKISPAEMRCIEIQAAGTGPGARAAHSAVAVNSRIYIFGGTSLSGDLNDLHCYDTLTNSWNEIIMSGIPPCPRMDFAFCCFTAHKGQTRIFLHGGVNSQSDILTDSFFCTI